MLTQIYKVSSRNIFIKMLFVFSLNNEYSYFFLRDNFASCSFSYSQVRNTRPPAIAFLKISTQDILIPTPLPPAPLVTNLQKTSKWNISFFLRKHFNFKKALKEALKKDFQPFILNRLREKG